MTYVVSIFYIPTFFESNIENYLEPIVQAAFLPGIKELEDHSILIVVAEERYLVDLMASLLIWFFNKDLMYA